jgi:putative ABC transport system substrate-binding protein
MTLTITRRQLAAAIGGATALPMAARGQQPMPVIGYLGSESAEPYASRLQAFRRGLREAGLEEGRNVAIEYRWAESQYERLPTLVADLVRRRAAVIVANGPAVAAAKSATSTIPIVFVIAGDPVVLGFVASLNRPGGNLTGVANLNVELGPKRLELLHELLPTTTAIAVLINPTNMNAERLTKEHEAAASRLGLALTVLHASSEYDFPAVFTAVVQRRVGALVIATDAFFNGRGGQLAALALRDGLPTIYNREFAAAGGLVSYGGSPTDDWRLVGLYAARVLRGEKPADLPVQQSTKVELVINLKTAKALGITVPITILGRADEVIE